MDTQVDSDMQSANISDFAQWVQQERFPLFVKVSFHLPFFRDIRHIKLWNITTKTNIDSITPNFRLLEENSIIFSPHVSFW